MVKLNLRIDPIRKEISYELSGNLDEIDSIDLDQIKKINSKAEKITKELGFYKKSSPPSDLPVPSLDEKFNKSTPIIHVLEDMLSKIEKLDEKEKFPVLWSFSSKPIMTVDEFLSECAEKGFTLSPSWLPRAGGHFSQTLVKRMKMFHKVGKSGNKSTWKLTDIGKLKVKQIIKKLK